MRLKTTMVLLLSAFFLAAGPANAQTRLPPETRNAALRYWLAFAELQDSPADEVTQALLEKVAVGQAAWDEAKLGPILDKNTAAILRMQRATQLPECDWGLEYTWRGSIAYAPRARVLGRLNTLYGMRRAARGDQSGAVSAWLAGIRFSQHVAEGGTLVFALVAQSTLLPNLEALTQASESGALSDTDRRRIENAVRALPESGFDWAAVLRTEEAILYNLLDEMARSPRPAELYAAAMGEPAPANFSLPSATDRSAYHRLMTSAQTALSPEDTKFPMAQLYGAGTHWFFQRATPSLIKLGETRSAITAARARLLQALAAKRPA